MNGCDIIKFLGIDKEKHPETLDADLEKYSINNDTGVFLVFVGFIYDQVELHFCLKFK